MRFQFIPLAVGSLGHLVLDTEKVLFEIKYLQASSSFTPIFIYSETPTNSFFVDQLNKEYCVLKGKIYFIFHRLLRRISEQYHNRDLQINRKSHKSLASIHTQPTLLSIKYSDSKNWDMFVKMLHQSGCQEYVCLIIRDSGFDEFLNRDEKNKKLQEMRHTNPNHFSKTIQYLNSEGLFVIRMGRHVNHVLQNQGIGYCEFASEFQSSDDSLDFQIFQNSKFVISTGSGPDNIGLFFRKKVFYINAIPIAAIPQTPLCPMALVPKFVYEADGTQITWQKVMESPLIDAGPVFLHQNGIKIVQRSSEEILQFVMQVVESLRSNNEGVTVGELPRFTL
jgi:putative glycosyltransferase (TIGR04372 family)